MIRAKDITKKYQKTEVLRGVSFIVEPGEIYGLLGANGAGKTTLLQILAGLIECDQGEIVIDSFNLGQDPDQANKALGYTPDQPFLYQYLTGEEYLNFIGDLWDIPILEKRRQVQELLSIFNLQDKAHSLISTYSFGMKQKLATAGALLPSPKVMVLDEPFTGFDPLSTRMMKDFFRRYADQGNSVIFSTHVLEVAKNFCDRVGLLMGGRIEKEITDPKIEENFEDNVIHIIDESIYS